MKVNQSLLMLSIMILTLSACGSLSLSNRGGTIKVENKPKQPNVIVNENVKDNMKSNTTEKDK
ncbi:hypothetical protein H4J38_03645 [Colwellia sp. BRX10-3]|uniref:hypothetical protein n=1 Tax=Colwellia sp. BRX10-3 TaxID=2759844 RepID=UPI0015F590AB|nr:hypothetical protein [Colwellia sp. BRX10-3]MBA6389870.1 hypothetical protein [Colwellia sp. BRX10-3]